MRGVPSLFTPNVTVCEYHTPPHTSGSVSEKEPIRPAVELGSIQHLHHGISAGNDDQRIGRAEFQTDDRSIDIGQPTPNMGIVLRLVHQTLHIEDVPHDRQAAWSSKFRIICIIILCVRRPM